MSGQIIDLQDWFHTPPGRYLLDWERKQVDRAVTDIFGYHALQLGLGPFDALRSNRMPHRWVAVPDQAHVAAHSIGEGQGVTPVSLVAHSAALPFPAASLDLVVLPHTLELSGDPHGTLREVERVLVPDGRVVITGLNPASLWGLRQRRLRLYRRLGWSRLFLPEEGEFIGYWRLRDWLRLLSFEVEAGQFGAYRPAVSSEKWLQRFQWMDAVGPRWWPILGAVYCLVAVKRVRGMRMIEPAWKTARARAIAPVSIANRSEKTGAGDPFDT